MHRCFFICLLGFYAYLSLLTVINAHDHPVVKVFVKCLIDGVKHKHNLDRNMTDFEGLGKNYMRLMQYLVNAVQFFNNSSIDLHKISL